jgi:hypothetical protein
MPVPVAAPPAVVFEHDVGTARPQARQRLGDVEQQRPQPLGEIQLFIECALEIHRWLGEIALQHEIVKIEYLSELGCEAVALVQVGDAHRAPRHFVFVRRTDAATGGADGVQAARVLARPVQSHVRRQYQRTGRGNAQAIEHRYALRAQHLRLAEQRLE